MSRRVSITGASYWESRGRMLLLAVGVAVLACAVPDVDPDLWGHIRYGLDYVRSSSVTDTDPYSYTAAGETWRHHDWLGETTLAAVWQFGGDMGLWALRAAFIGAVLALVRLGSGATPLTPTLIVSALFWNVLAIGLAYRPQLFTYVLFAFVLMMVAGVRRGSMKPVVAATILPPLFAVWANLHGGWPVGLAIIGLAVGAGMFDAIVRSDAPARRRIAWFVAITVSCATATLANPQGWGLWHQVFADLSVPRAGTLSEWLPVEPFSVDQWAFKLLACIAVAGIFRTKPSTFELAVLAVTAAAGFAHVRHTVFFGIAAAMFVPQMLVADATRQPERRNVAVGVASGLTVALLLVATRLIDVRLFVSTDRCPTRVFGFLRENRLNGNLTVEFDWSQAAIWHLGGDPVEGIAPTCRVAYDGRHRSVYPTEIERAYFAFHGFEVRDEIGSVPWDRLLTDQPTQMVLMRRTWLNAHRMRKRPGWRLVIDGEVLLFVREGVLPHVVSAYTPPSEPTRFPGEP